MFILEVDSKVLNNQVFGVIAKIPVPFHLPESNGCNLGASCPVKAGDNVTESVTLPILSEYPKVIFFLNENKIKTLYQMGFCYLKLSLYVKWEVFDDSNKQMICFMFPVQIQ
jgi:hypothetical protein